MRLPLNSLSLITLTLLLSLASSLPSTITSLNTKTLAQPPTNQARKAEAENLLQKGIQQSQNRQYTEAIETYQQVLAIARAIGDKAILGETLHRIGAIYNNLDDYPQALNFFAQALAIRKQIDDKTGVGSTLNSMGGVYQQQGQYDQALKLYQQSLAIRREIGDKAGEGRTLNNIASLYDSQGKYAQAIEAYQQALAIFKELDNKTGVGALLSNIGLVYSELGQHEQALKFYQQSLAIRREIDDKAGIGKTLHNIGFAYDEMGQNTQALEFYQQALAVRRQIKDKAGEATTLNNIGFFYNKIGQYPKAIESLEQALALFQEIGNRAGVGRTIDSIGTVYKSLGEYSKSLASYQQSLAIQREVGDKAGERITLSNIGSLLEKQKQPQLAIIFYKESVNLTEKIRKDLTVLSREQQESYTKTVVDTYRSLADLLLKQNRVLEAQQVLDLLKVQELDDYLHKVRGTEQTSQGVELLSQEKTVQKNYADIENQAIDLGKELAQLEVIPPDKRTPAQQQRIVTIRKAQQDITKQFNEFIRSPAVVVLTQRLNQETAGENLNLQNLNNLRSTLVELKQNAVILYPLILEDRLELVLVTPYSPPIRRTVNIKREDLNRAIAEFRTTLTNRRNSTATVKVSAKQIYNLLIKPIENDLAQAKAETIIYAPDGQLRYIPLAAVFDGKQWLVERFRIDNITALSLTKLNTEHQTQPRVLAGAFAKGNYSFHAGTRQFNFSGLPFAAREVETLAATIPGTTKLIDKDFSRDAMVPRMNDYNIVHLATHAAFVNGEPEESFILFGDGSSVSLPEVRNWVLPNVDLVVLSACQTGVGGQLGNGVEILGFGYQIEQTGARASIASLWTVDDGGTETLMTAFYTALKQGNISKAEALRQAQIALISRESSDLARPYYWAPFILIGNGL
jgi:CHAT domain-containing protein/Tfp pilus assembly protein PilF